MVVKWGGINILKTALLSADARTVLADSGKLPKTILYKSNGDECRYADRSIGMRRNNAEAGSAAEIQKKIFELKCYAQKNNF